MARKVRVCSYLVGVKVVNGGVESGNAAKDG